MERIKGFSREVEPSIVEAIQPVMGKTKYAKPYHEKRIVEGETIK
jgi:hypothetical protein